MAEYSVNLILKTCNLYIQDAQFQLGYAQRASYLDTITNQSEEGKVRTV
jgi:hypothetical protein